MYCPRCGSNVGAFDYCPQCGSNVKELLESLETKENTEHLQSYIKSKFFRTMLGVLKITQHNEIGTFRLVPLQDFTPASDIDWSKSIPEIDQQLYAKYGLDAEEIDFIETHVKPMT